MKLRKLFRSRLKPFCVLMCSVVFSAFSIIGCGNTASTAENASPESLYSSDRDIDLFVYEDTAYVNALDIDWGRRTVSCERQGSRRDLPFRRHG